MGRDIDFSPHSYGEVSRHTRRRGHSVRRKREAMIIVHHLNDSRSQRILWLLEELGLPYEIAPYQRDPETRLAPAALRAIHPRGTSPVTPDGARTMAESGAITEYIIRHHGGGRLQPAAGTTDHDAY